MVKACCVRDCDSKRGGRNKIQFHRFPSNATLKRKWMQSVQVRDKITSTSVVCGRHFLAKDYKKVRGETMLKTNAVPSVDCGSSDEEDESESSTGSQEVLEPPENVGNDAQAQVDVALPLDDDRIEPKLVNGVNEAEMSSEDPTVTETTKEPEIKTPIEQSLPNGNENTALNNPLDSCQENNVENDSNVETTSSNVDNVMKNDIDMIESDVTKRNDTQTHENENTEENIKTDKLDTEISDNLDNKNAIIKTDDIKTPKTEDNNVISALKEPKNEIKTDNTKLDSETSRNEVTDKRNDVTVERNEVTDKRNEDTDERNEVSDERNERKPESADVMEATDLETLITATKVSKDGENELKRTDNVCTEVKTAESIPDSTDNDDCEMVVENVQVDVDLESLMQMMAEPEEEEEPPHFDTVEIEDDKPEEPVSLLTSSDDDDVILQEPHIDTVEVSDETDEDELPLKRLCNTTKTQQPPNLNQPEKINRLFWGGMREFYCYLCPHVSKSQTDLKEHMLTHNINLPSNADVLPPDETETQILVCENCDYQTASKYQYLNHKKKHRDDKKYKCNVCDYKAKHRMSLVYHMRSHEASEPDIFKCNDCSFKTKYINKMHGHLRIHKPVEGKKSTSKSKGHSSKKKNENVSKRKSDIRKRAEARRSKVSKKGTSDDEYVPGTEM